MAVRTDSPQVALLLKAVEQEFGRAIKTPSDFVLVADRVETKTHFHISESTIKRLWKPVLGYGTVSDHTLNVLSAYVGHEHFDAFIANLAGRGLLESELIMGEECVKSEDLVPGDIVSIAWMPDRECELRYLGERKFEAVKCVNSTIQVGDTFFCSNFMRGRKLYVDNLVHGSETFESYGMGTSHGLTRVEVRKK